MLSFRVARSRRVAVTTVAVGGIASLASLTLVPASAAQSAGRSGGVRSLLPVSGILNEGGTSGSTSLGPVAGAAFPAAVQGAGTVTVGPNVDVIAGQDVIQKKVIHGQNVQTCNPGIGTAQNETTIAVNPSDPQNLVAGENDYRLYEATENRYDSSGGFDTSTDGGTTWTAGFLPGLVQANKTAPGPYQAAGDPSLSAGPSGTFWYGNLVFNRNNAASAVSASVSHDGGKTWTTSYAIKTSAKSGATLLNDKDYIGADPANAKHAVVTWTQFHPSTSDIVFSQTTNGGKTWSKPKEISASYPSSQGSIPVVSGKNVYVVYEATDSQGVDHIAFSKSSDGGSTWKTKLLAVDSDVPGLSGWTPRLNSFPTFAVDGTTLHIVWPNWNGTNAELAYLRSTDGGSTWTGPTTLAKSSADNFFPWVAAQGGKVYVTYFHHPAPGEVYGIDGIASTTGGSTWTAQVAVSSKKYNAGTGNEFGYPSCAFSFIGDYSGSTVDTSGVDHVLWTGITTGTGANQDPFTATIKA